MNTPVPEHDPSDQTPVDPGSTDVPRRAFLKFAGTLSSATAAGIYLATDARLKAHAPAPFLPTDHVDPAHQYAY